MWLNDLEEMRKLSEVKSSMDSEEAKKASAEDLENNKKRTDEVREYLKQEGVPVKAMIGSTHLVKNVNDMEFEYRLWSNLSHGNPYALNRSGKCTLPGQKVSLRLSSTL